MKRQSTATERVVFQIEFVKGRADRHRLPLDHVISTLQQLDLMVREVGRRIQRESGMENPDGDFGIELLAGPTGIAFSKGSLKTAAAATRDLANAEKTLRSVIGTTKIVEKKSVGSLDEFGAPVVRRLTTIGDIQEQDKTELRLKLASQGRITDTATFSEKGIETLKSLREADLSISSVTLYGKLRKVADYARTEDEIALWGELVDDGGETWRVSLKNVELKRVQSLFTKQVVVFGDANYFKATTPRLDARTIAEDKDRSYEKAFRRFRKNYKDILGDQDAQAILRNLRGEPTS